MFYDYLINDDGIYTIKWIFGIIGVIFVLVTARGFFDHCDEETLLLMLDPVKDFKIEYKVIPSNIDTTQS